MTELNIEYAPKSDNTEADIWHDRIVEYLRKYLSQPFYVGNPGAFHFTQTDLTMDATYRNLDCSSVVPEDAIAIIFNVWVKDAGVGTKLYLTKNGDNSGYSALVVETQVADIYCHTQGIVFCDTSRIVDYYASAAFDNIGINITGWFK